MLYSLVLELVDQYSFLNVFRYLTFRTGLAMFTSMAIVLLVGTPFINFFSNKILYLPYVEISFSSFDCKIITIFGN